MIIAGPMTDASASAVVLIVDERTGYDILKSSSEKAW